MDKELEKCLEVIEHNVGVLERRTSGELGLLVHESKGLRLDLWNGIRSTNKLTPTAQLWTPHLRFFQSWAPTVEEGLWEVLSKIRSRLELSDYGIFELSQVSFSSFGVLMQEISEIASLKEGLEGRFKVGRHRGPHFHLTLKSFVGQGAVLRLKNRSSGEDSLVFEHEGEHMLSSLEEVIAQAQDHFASYERRINGSWQEKFLEMIRPARNASVTLRAGPP